MDKSDTYIKIDCQVVQSCQWSLYFYNNELMCCLRSKTAAINSWTNLKVLAPPLGHMGLNDVILSVLEDSAAAQLAVSVACTSTVSASTTHHNNAKLWLELSSNNYCKWNYVLMESADAMHKVPGSAYI